MVEASALVSMREVETTSRGRLLASETTTGSFGERQMLTLASASTTASTHN